MRWCACRLPRLLRADPPESNNSASAGADRHVTAGGQNAAIRQLPVQNTGGRGSKRQAHGEHNVVPQQVPSTTLVIALSHSHRTHCLTHFGTLTGWLVEAVKLDGRE